MDSHKYATEIVMRLVSEGHIAYFAGGWVRDFVMKHPSSDIDIATDAPPQKILDLFPRTILVGIAFGVVIVSVNGHQFEVSSFRKDFGYQDGRRPERIEFATPQEDASRRDFTINGMFYDPIENVIHDFVGGVEDIKKGIIRTIGDPQERFVEDRLRMVRAVRFASRFGFLIHSDTQEAIKENADTLFPAVAMERVWQEFNKMANYPRFDAAIIEMYRLELLQEIFPLLQGVHLHDIKQRVAHFIRFPKKCPTILYLMELFPGLPVEDKLDLCRYLKISGKEANLVEFEGRLENMIKSGSGITADWAYCYADPRFQMCLEVIASRLPEPDRSRLLEFHKERKEALLPHVERIETKKPLVTAAILQAQGILPGKVMGNLLKEAERIAIAADLHDAKTVVEHLKQSHLWPK